ncbi:S49 family peptidase [Kouleothrix sp.]|uniref:S49 family peptidase n=1 Tax=Kouleothrix sp. TaxID=2779161 RepID=UPI003918E340
MLSIIAIWLINLSRAARNGWRLLLRRRVEWVRFELGGGLPEFASAPSWWQRRFLGMREPASLHGLRRKFQRIAADPHARGVVLKIDGLAAGWATLQSLRDEIARLRLAGKRVVAYLVSADMAGYHAATAADTLVVPPAVMLNILGVRAEVQFLKDALAKIGVTAEYEAVSPYKSAGEPFVRSDISDENRAQLARIVDARFDGFVRAVAADRGLSEDAVRQAIDAAPLSAPAARERGLIDAVLYEDELEAFLAPERAENTDAKARRRPAITGWGYAARALQLPMARRQRKLVAVVPIEGAIAPGRSRNLPIPIPLIGGAQAGAASVIQALRQAERAARAAAVVLYVNSPGGDVLASDLIWREVLRLRRRKPVVVAMGDVAASGGYYVAAPASAIVAQPGTLTGSIGVFSLRPIVAGLLERAAINTVVLSRGARSGLLSAGLPPTDDERQAQRAVVLHYYADFKQRVSEGRGIGLAQLEPIAGGRVWLGDEAIERGLADQLGGLPEAVARARELAGLPADAAAPLMLLRGGRQPLPPQPFPQPSPNELLALLHEALRPRVLAMLPFHADQLL